MDKLLFDLRLEGSLWQGWVGLMKDMLLCYPRRLGRRHLWFDRLDGLRDGWAAFFLYSFTPSVVVTWVVVVDSHLTLVTLVRLVF